MGIYDRPYYRDGKGGGGGGDRNAWFGDTGHWPPVVKWLIIINVVVFLLQLAQDGIGDSLVHKWFGLETNKVLSGEIWRILTCSFLHDRYSLLHILFNMLFLVWFGRTLEQMYGSREFAWFYGCAAFAASVAFLALDLLTGHHARMIGASGPIMGVMMLYAMHFPRQKIMLFMVIPIEIRWLILLYIVFDTYPVLLLLSGVDSGSGVAHAAHLGGVALGFFYYRNKWNLSGVADRFQSKAKAKQSERQDEAETRFDSRVDAILDKINKDGIGSLTEAEKKAAQEIQQQIQGPLALR